MRALAALLASIALPSWAANTCSPDWWEHDIDYHNFQGLGHAPSTSAADCCEQCSKFPKCTHFTLSSGMCWFKDSNAGKRSKKGAISGSVGAPPPPPPPPPPHPPVPSPSPQPAPAPSPPLTQPVKVFILMGQSNMLGEGAIHGWKDGTLDYAVTAKHLYPYLLDKAGNWAVRNDARNVFVMGSGNSSFEAAKLWQNEWMTAGGDSRKTIGPELGIGNFVANLTGGPVMFLKSCIGDRALGWDLLPPGGESFEYTDTKNVTWVYAGYHQSPNRWKKGEQPKPMGWMAGEQYDDDTNLTQHILANISAYYPGATTYEVAGFFWWQGDKDSRDAGLSDRYEHNLVLLINALRKQFKSPNAKFVTASLGQTVKGTTDGGGKILDAMLAVDGKSGKYPEFKGNVAAVYSHPLSEGSSSGSHYGGNAETYMNIGEAMGNAMVELLKGSESSISV